MTDASPSSPRGESRAARARHDAAAAVSRELPHHLELERAILGVLLDGRHATAMHKARALIEHPLAFYQRDHRIVYLACLELDDGGHRVDAQAVAELLSRYSFAAILERLKQQMLLFDSDQLDGLGRDRLRALYRRDAKDLTEAYEESGLAAIGGFTALTDLAGAFAPAAGLERNITLLWDYYLKRRLIVRLQLVSDKAYRTPDSFVRLLDECGQTILDLGRQQRNATVHGMADVVNETLDDIQERSNNPEAGIKTGLADVDDKLMALRPGGLYVLAARPGVGKTSLALKIVGHIAGNVEARQSVLFFSLEVDRKDLVKKLLASESAVDFKKIEQGTLERHELSMLAETADRFKHWNLDLMDVSDLTVNALRSVVKRRMLETGSSLKLVVLDYLQLLSSGKSDASEYEKVSEISRVLKVLARELRLPVLALSQMSRDSEKGVGSQPREPRLSDLRGSGSIEQDADAVLFMHRCDQGEGSSENECRKIKVIVAKNRFGPTGATDMDFYPAKMRFVEASHQHAEDDGGGDLPVASRSQRLESGPSASEDLFG